jgi:hypothetical protein
VQVAIFKILSSNALLGLVCCVIQSQGKVFKSFPENGAKNVSTRNHPQIAWKESPVPIKLYMNVRVF